MTSLNKHIVTLIHWVCFAFGKGTTIVISHIIIVYFRAPKAQSIFGIHTQRRCQKVRLGHYCVGSIGIYVPLHGLGFDSVSVAKVKLTVANLLVTVTDATNVTKYRVTTSSRTLLYQLVNFWEIARLTDLLQGSCRKSHKQRG